MRIAPIPELATPLPLLAVALLALNDHALKRLALVTRWSVRARAAVGAFATTDLVALPLAGAAFLYAVRAHRPDAELRR